MKYERFISIYFKSEQLESLLLLVIGAVALIEGLYFQFGEVIRPFYQGLSWPLMGFALAEIGWGAGIYIRSQIDIRKIDRYYKEDRGQLRSKELPRIQQLLRNYVIYRWIWAIACSTGVLLIIFMNSFSDFWMGVGVGFWLQGGILWVSEWFAERRGMVYLEELEKL